MRLAIFSDIHGNLPALQAVLADIRGQQFDAVYCLGDLVGYGPFPNEVTERVRLEQIPTIMGNYDDGVGFERDDCGCAYREADEKRRGDQSLAWTKAHVTAETRHFFDTGARTPLRGRRTRVLLVHGSPRRSTSTSSRTGLFRASTTRGLLERGHHRLSGTHTAVHELVDDVLFVNVGSVGKPKDGDWRGCYAILDTQKPGAEFVRIEYDLARVTKEIRASELPPEFASDLEHGGTPMAP